MISLVRYARLVLFAALLLSAFFAVALPLAAISSPGQPDVAAPVVILVRHAEKAAEPAEDPPLTATGTQRAQDLADALKYTNVTAIITTEFRRTLATAEPIGSKQGVKPICIGLRSIECGSTDHPRTIDEHVTAVKAKVRSYVGGVVLVIGHDITVPAIIMALGGPPLPNICSDSFDELFVLFPGDGGVRLVKSRYGAPSPGLGRNCK
jgi:broad specificity phosphatase PhoE